MGGAAVTFVLIESPSIFITEDSVKASTSMGDAWKGAFNGRVARVYPKCRNVCSFVEIVDNSALTLKRCDAGSVKTWVHKPSICIVARQDQSRRGCLRRIKKMGKKCRSKNLI